ncbi:Class I SAM-dependent methyltransferase [Candidatus Magnetomoraceae bacterium gMMP-1]
MDINTSHICNLLSLKLMAEYYDVDYSELENYYKELETDNIFLKSLNKKIDACRNLYPKGLFLNKNISSIDWFGNQRISLYVLIRLLKPETCVETGVFYGGTTAFILNALKKNQKGRLISIDLPGDKANTSCHRHEKVGDSELVPEGLQTGFIIPDYLKESWKLIENDSLNALKELKETFTFFSHDSEHSRSFMKEELELAKSKMPGNSTIFADDINWSNGFFEFCVKHKLYPLFLTDNGKDGLKVRLGLVRLDHQNNGKIDITG